MAKDNNRCERCRSLASSSDAYWCVRETIIAHSNFYEEIIKSVVNVELVESSYATKGIGENQQRMCEQGRWVPLNHEQVSPLSLVI